MRHRYPHAAVIVCLHTPNYTRHAVRHRRQRPSEIPRMRRMGRNIRVTLAMTVNAVTTRVRMRMTRTAQMTKMMRTKTDGDLPMSLILSRADGGGCANFLKLFFGHTFVCFGVIY